MYVFMECYGKLYQNYPGYPFFIWIIECMCSFVLEGQKKAKMNKAGLLSLKLFPFYTTIKMPSSVTIRRDKNE